VQRRAKVMRGMEAVVEQNPVRHHARDIPRVIVFLCGVAVLELQQVYPHQRQLRS
jgi:hypothetical protein